MKDISYLKLAHLVGISYDPPREKIFLKHLCNDSRKATPLSAFFCIVGAIADGHDYALAAYMNGCRVFVCERRPDGLPDDALVIIARDGTRVALAEAAAEFYGHPERGMTLVGITGTKGKTTTACLICSMLSKCGRQAGYIGTNGVDFLDHHYDTVNTTPESCEIFFYLSLMKECGIKIAVIEASSQALLLDRLHGIKFDICVFTNLYPDHIGKYEHPSYENYRECKLKLFSEHCRGTAVVNIDSPEAPAVLAAAKNTRIFTCSSSGNPADFRASDIETSNQNHMAKTLFTCTDSRGKTEMCLGFPGEYNVSNALLAFAVCSLFEDDRKALADALAESKVKGRFESFFYGGVNYIIDYAHNGASLRSVLGALRECHPKRLICLFGSVGGRTFNRREQLGRAAAELADISIVTSDNPDCEDPEKIIDDICAYFPDDSKYFRIADRADAIRFAVRIAQPGDIVLLAGKGHEKYQLICGVKVPFIESNILASACEAMQMTV